MPRRSTSRRSCRGDHDDLDRAGVSQQRDKASRPDLLQQHHHHRRRPYPVPVRSRVCRTRTNQLFVTDIPSRLEAVQEMIRKLDVPVRQVMIEARIVEASDSFSRSLGVKFGGSDLRGIRGGDAGYSIGGGNRAAFGGSYDAVSATTLERVQHLTSANTSFVNLPAASIGSTDPARLALSLFSPTANRFLDLEISALQADGKGKVVASPRVITGDQTQAEIEQGWKSPIRPPPA